MAQLTKKDILDALKEYGVVSDKNFDQKFDKRLISSLKKYGVVTETSLDKKFKSYGVSIKKDLVVLEGKIDKSMDKKLHKLRKRLFSAIANVSLNSPTDNEFSKLEGRVGHLEGFHNYL